MVLLVLPCICRTHAVVQLVVPIARFVPCSLGYGSYTRLPSFTVTLAPVVPHVLRVVPVDYAVQFPAFGSVPGFGSPFIPRLITRLVRFICGCSRTFWFGYITHVAGYVTFTVRWFTRLVVAQFTVPVPTRCGSPFYFGSTPFGWFSSSFGGPFWLVCGLYVWFAFPVIYGLFVRTFTGLYTRLPRLRLLCRLTFVLFTV